MSNKNLRADLDLSGDSYTIKQRLIRNKYSVYDSNGDLILQAKQKLFKLKEQFPFTTPDGEPVFQVQASSILDVAGDYTITDAQTEEPIAILDKNWTLLTHRWKVRDPEDERLLATIESRGALWGLLRNIPYLSIITQLIPHKYTIETGDGTEVGSLEGKFSIRDIYHLSLGDTGDIPKESLVIAAIAIDALEGN